MQPESSEAHCEVLPQHKLSNGDKGLKIRTRMRWTNEENLKYIEVLQEVR